jgi:hypothetical protein
MEAMVFSSESVGQTGSLPGFPNDRIKGIKANCQFALPSRRDSYSLQSVATRHEGSFENQP